MASDRDTRARVKQLVCQDILDSLDEAARLDARIDFFESFLSSPPRPADYKKSQPRAWIQGWSYGLGNF